MGAGEKASFRQRMLELCSEYERLQERCNDYADDVESMRVKMAAASADASKVDGLAAENAEMKAKLAAFSEQAGRCGALMAENRELKSRVSELEETAQRVALAANQGDKVGLPPLSELVPSVAALPLALKDAGDSPPARGEAYPRDDVLDTFLEPLLQRELSPRKRVTVDSDSSGNAARRRSPSKGLAVPKREPLSGRCEAEDRAAKQPKHKKERKRRGSDPVDEQEDSDGRRSRSPSSGSSIAGDSDDDGSLSPYSTSSSGSDNGSCSSSRRRRKKRDGKDGKEKRKDRKDRRARSERRDRSRRRDRRHRERHGKRRRRKTRRGHKKDRSRSRSGTRSRSRAKPRVSPRRTFGSGDHRTDLDGFISKNQLEARVAHALRTMSEADQRRVMGTDGGENSYLLIDRVKNPNAVVMSRIRKLEGQ